MIPGYEQPWWDAAAEGRLVVQRCGRCGHHQHYPRAICTSCHATEALDYVAASGRGTVYSYTVVHRSPGDGFDPPYTIGLVRLEEGPVLLTRLQGEPSCDAPVEVSFEEMPGGPRMPVFTVRR